MTRLHLIYVARIQIVCIHLYPFVSPVAVYKYPYRRQNCRHGDIYPLVSGYKLLVRDICRRLHVSGVNAALDSTQYGAKQWWRLHCTKRERPPDDDGDCEKLVDLQLPFNVKSSRRSDLSAVPRLITKTGLSSCTTKHVDGSPRVAHTNYRRKWEFIFLWLVINLQLQFCFSFLAGGAAGHQSSLCFRMENTFTLGAAYWMSCDHVNYGTPVC